MPEINNTEFNAIVERAVHAVSLDAKRDAVNEAVRLMYVTETFTKWAKSIAYGRGYRDAVGIKDIEQVIAEKVLQILHDLTPKGSASVGDWLRALYGLATNAVIDYLASSQVTVASKMSGAVKRRNIIARFSRQLLADLGRVPTRAEIIETANAWAYEAHANPRKQGVLLSDEDFQNHSMEAMDMDVAQHFLHEPSEAETSSEAHLALRRVRECAQSLFPDDADLLVVVGAWAQCIADAERPTQKGISESTGLDAAVVRAGLVRLNDVLDEVRDLFGDS